VANAASPPTPTDSKAGWGTRDHKGDIPGTRDLLDAAISHIYLAGILIHTRRETAESGLADELDHVTGELDAAVRHLQAAVLGKPDRSSTKGLAFDVFSAWSDRELRWINLNFQKYQAWLARPDLDPRAFVSDEVQS